MIVQVLWYGGVGYDHPYPDDLEAFASIQEAKDEFWRRSRNMSYPHTPNVDTETTNMLVFISKTRDISTDCPDRVIKFGPRKGIICEKC